MNRPPHRPIVGRPQLPLHEHRPVARVGDVVSVETLAEFADSVLLLSGEITGLTIDEHGRFTGGTTVDHKPLPAPHRWATIWISPNGRRRWRIPTEGGGMGGALP
jgi:hypothetical protein